MIQGCRGCQEAAVSPPRTPIHRWEYPALAWQRLHVDFAGPMLGRMYLIIVDDYSICPEIVEMKTTTAEVRVTQLRRVIARMGISHRIVSDNGPQFTSEVFRRFTRANGIKHVTGATYHPSMNGIMERFVRSFKRAVKADHTEITALHKLDKFLFAYRTA